MFGEYYVATKDRKTRVRKVSEFRRVRKVSEFRRVRKISTLVIHNDSPPHTAVEVTLGVELRCTAEVLSAESPKLKNSIHPIFRLLGNGNLAKIKPLLRFTIVLAKCRKVAP
ncbi:hypothetical protein RB195_023676 [Necator americanus]|uniref:Uncharacterized protein n=1 Tax=Necator americanus TaxID=51031 RepID=A0ABR1EMI6_NECAM